MLLEQDVMVDFYLRYICSTNSASTASGQKIEAKPKSDESICFCIHTQSNVPEGTQIEKT